MRAITDRQREILDFIKLYLREHNYPPTVREIAEHFSISVKGSHDHIRALQKKNIIRCNSNRSRTIEVLGEEELGDEPQVRSVPILGAVAAGRPIFSEENYAGSVNLPFDFIPHGDFFALTVQGDSMIDAGIHDGDLAIIRQQSVADNGDIVVAMLEDAYTIKTLYIEKNRIKLQPQNPAYQPTYTSEARILGKLAYLIRNYGQ